LPELRFSRTERYIGLPVSVEKIGIVNSLRGVGRRKSDFPAVWICSEEVGRNGGVGGRRERVVEIDDGATVEDVMVFLVATVSSEGE
jgi:hypothetical protein